MKIRNGFVSNSSTSSFLIFGVEVSDSEIIEAAEQLKLTLTTDEDYYSYDAGEAIADKLGLEFYSVPDNCYFIGRSWDGVKDDETGAQFKQSITDILKPLFPETNVETHQAAWHD